MIRLCRGKNEVDAWESCHEKASVLVVAIFLACPTFAVKGRTAAADTDIVMRTEVLTDSRSRGLFAGVSLEGSTLRCDGSANKKLYGRDISAKEIVRQGNVGLPASGRELIALLDKQSSKNASDPVSLKE